MREFHPLVLFSAFPLAHGILARFSVNCGYRLRHGAYHRSEGSFQVLSHL